MADGWRAPAGVADDGDIGFDDLFDLDAIQRLQDEFADATGVASLITHTDGTPLTRPSRFCRLCSEIIRQTERGLANCYRSDAQIGRLCTNGPTVQPCLSGGLWDAGAGITVGGRHIANWLVGQVRDETQTEAGMRAYARAIGADENQVAQAFLEVPAMSRERFEKIARAVFTLARQLSELAYRNVQQSRLIAERKQAESRILFQAQVLDNVNEAVVVTDLQGRILYWGHGAEVLYGYRPPEVLGRPYRAFAGAVDATDEPAFRNELLAVGSWHGENLQRRRDGSTFWSDVHISVMRDADGQPTGFIGIDHDISEQKQAEAERERLRERTAEAQKMETVGRLAGGVAHDFNNLLMAIMGYTELCRSTLAPGHSGCKELDEIAAACERAAALTRQLLAFARKQVIAPKVLDVNDAVSGTLKLLRRLLGEHIELAWEPAANPWPVRIDPGQLDQLLTNLCVNARDAITGCGRIVIATANASYGAPWQASGCEVPAGDYLALSVSDTGSGIEPQMLGRIFEPFFTTKARGAGTGLGLATVHGIVTQNGGSVDVQSEPGKGSLFRLLLPRALEPAEALPPSEEVRLARGLETVLLAEDDPAVRDAAGRILSQQGYRVLAASSAEDALRLAAAHDGEIALLVTDVIMPGLSGRALAQRLSLSRPALRCLYISGYTADLIASHGVLEEGVAFLPKPFSRGELACAVRQLLDRAAAPAGA